MHISEQIKDEILSVHNTLWNAVYDESNSILTVNYLSKDYPIRISKEHSFASALLPNSNGISFLWITQNLNKSSYATLNIQRDKSKGLDTRITWVVDTRNGQFNYKSNIRTTVDSNGLLTYSSIENYTDYGTTVLWSTVSHEITQKAKF